MSPQTHTLKPTPPAISPFQSLALPVIWWFQQKAQKSFLILLFSSVPTYNPLSKPCNSTFRTYPELDHFSSPPWLPPQAKPAASHTWTIAALLTGPPNTAIRVSFLDYKSHHVTKLKTYQQLPVALRVVVKPIVRPQGLWDLVHTSLPSPGSHHSHSHRPVPLPALPLTSLRPSTSAFIPAILDKPTWSHCSTCRESGSLLHIIQMSPVQRALLRFLGLAQSSLQILK